MEKRRIGVRAIVYKDGKLLAVRHKSKSGTQKDFWCVPGGGLDPGESLEAGLQREMREELGIDVVIGRLLFMQQFASTRADCSEELEFFFLVENVGDFDVIDYTHTSHGTEELARCEFIDAANERVLPEFLGTLDLEKYTSTVQPVYVIDLLDKSQ